MKLPKTKPCQTRLEKSS